MKSAILPRLAATFTWPLDPQAALDTVAPRRPTATRGVVTKVTRLTERASSLQIRVGRGWQPHRPGQFVTVGVDVDGVRHQRCFSLTSVPDRRSIEITVQAVDGGTVSPHLAHRIRPGEVVHLTPAAGDFTLSEGDGPLLFVSGGSGITPFLGMIRSLVAAGTTREVTLVHHAPTPQQSIAREELGTLQGAHDWLTVHHEFTAAGGRHLSGAGLDRVVPDWRGRDAYVCGPARLRDAAIAIWSDAHRMDRLRIESFQPSIPKAPRDGAAVTARCVRSGASVLVRSGASLLEAAERAGLTPPAGCRMGICHTCTTPLRAGVARDLRDGRTVEAGTHVQLCVSTALTDLELDL
jgi:ferredoxin-NADP reductase